MAGLTRDRDWYAVVFRYQGLRCKEYLHIQDEREAQRFVARLEKAMLHGTFDYRKWFPNSRYLVRLGLAAPVGNSMTVAEYVTTKWLPKKKGVLSPGTYVLYEGMIRNHILARSIAGMPLSAVRKSDIELLIAGLQEVTGARQVNGVIARLKTIFSDAVDDEIIDKDPMLKIETVRQARVKIDPFTLDEAELIAATAEGWERPLVTVLIFAGLRPGEALALKWDDIDFHRKLINVSSTWTKWGVHAPKTEGREEQPVQMLEGVYQALQQQRARSQLKSRIGWVFPQGELDKPVREDNFRERNWKAIQRRAGLKQRNLYQCRHSFAAITLSAFGAQWVASQLGHTSLQMVTQVYSRPNVKQAAYTVEQIEASIARALGIARTIAMKEQEG